MAAERVDECAIGKNDMVGEFDSDIEEGVRAFFYFFIQNIFSKWPSQLSKTKVLLFLEIPHLRENMIVLFWPIFISVLNRGGLFEV